MLLTGLAAFLMCSQGEQIDDASRAVWERIPCTHLSVVTCTLARVFSNEVSFLIPVSLICKRLLFSVLHWCGLISSTQDRRGHHNMRRT